MPLGLPLAVTVLVPLPVALASSANFKHGGRILRVVLLEVLVLVRLRLLLLVVVVVLILIILRHSSHEQVAFTS